MLMLTMTIFCMTALRCTALRHEYRGQVQGDARTGILEKYREIGEVSLLVCHILAHHSTFLSERERGGEECKHVYF